MDIFRQQDTGLAAKQSACPFVIFHTGLLAVPLTRYLERGTLFSCNRSDLFVHTHGWDNVFERFWRNPKKDLTLLVGFAGMFTPDFSQFRDFDFPLCLWNLRRNRILANWFLENEIEVLPSASWWDESSLDHCLDGLPKRSIIEVSNVNTRKDPQSDRIFDLGLKRVRDVLDPLAIVLYGNRLEKPFDGPPILYYQNSHYTGNGCSYLNQEQLQLMKED